METQFVDRILKCADCSGDFIFTAGEQLFFYDKQFKNDPKRCKPCKSRRSGLAAAAAGNGLAAAGLARTETRTECSDCGVQTTVPFKPTQGRPVLCRQCFQLKGRAVKSADMPLAAVPVQTPAQTAYALTEASENSFGMTLSTDAAVLAAASMAAAPAGSSVASAADLASLMGAEPAAMEQVPAALLAGEADSVAHLVPAELRGESAEA